MHEHHRPDGTFVNPWLDGRVRGFRDLLRWGIERRLHPPPPDPDPAPFPRIAPRYAFPRAAPAALTITWIGHASTLIQVAGHNVLIDPMFSQRASPLPFAGPRRRVPPGVPLEELPPIDLVLISHNHYDHLDARSVRALARRFPDALWLAPLRVGPLLRSLGARRVDEADWWGQRSAGPLTVTATPAQHFSSRRLFDRNRTLWCGFVLAGGGRRVFFAGDTGYHPAFPEIGRALGPFDAALLPVGAYEPRWFMRSVHMSPEEAVSAYLELAAGDAGRCTLVPVHWGTFKLTDEPLDEPPARTRAAWHARGLPDERLWIPRHGETRTW